MRVELDGQVLGAQPQGDEVRVDVVVVCAVAARQEKSGAIGGERQAHASDILREEPLVEGHGGRDGAVGQADLERAHRAGFSRLEIVGVHVALRVRFGQGDGADNQVGVLLIKEGGADHDRGQGALRVLADGVAAHQLGLRRGPGAVLVQEHRAGGEGGDVDDDGAPPACEGLARLARRGSSAQVGVAGGGESHVGRDVRPCRSLCEGRGGGVGSGWRRRGGSSGARGPARPAGGQSGQGGHGYPGGCGGQEGPTAHDGLRWSEGDCEWEELG